MTLRRRTLLFGSAIVWLLGAAACDKPGGACPECGTVAIAATGEPTALLPPLVFETVARDISDLVFERLADLEPSGAPIDESAYRPRLAERWERLDSLTWRFHLRPHARWQDGQPVTAADVVFSFDAFADSLLDSPARPYLAGRISVTAEDSETVRVRFAKPSPEQLYDATYHVRIIPRHIWEQRPRDQWQADTTIARLVGSGPYRLAEWRRGEFLVLTADSTAQSDIRRAVWRFAPDPDAALNLILSHEADLMEAVGAPNRVARVAADSSYRLERYPSAVCGFLAFRLADSAGRAHPVLGDRAVRRALASATDRGAIARAVFGASTRVPAGPMSQLLWIRDDSIRALPFDTAAARAMLDAAGWRRRSPGMPRMHGSQPLKFDILVPSTSPPRRQLAVALQEAWRGIGADVSVTAVDFAVFQQRLGQGRFDSYIGALLDEPSARGLVDSWTRAGWGSVNYGYYDNPAFDSLFGRASVESSVTAARPLYRAAMDTLNADAPAIFLYTPVNAAAVHRRITNVKIDPYAWARRLSEWQVDGKR